LGHRIACKHFLWLHPLLPLTTVMRSCLFGIHFTAYGNVESCSKHVQLGDPLPETYGKPNFYYMSASREFMLPRPHCKVVIDGMGNRNYGLTIVEQLDRAFKKLTTGQLPQRTQPIGPAYDVSLHVYRNGR
jgi:hypothetical protein